MKSKKLFWLETVVCSARKGVDARLERMLEARQEMRRRTDGCIRAWVTRSIDKQPMFLLQKKCERMAFFKNLSLETLRAGGFRGR